MEEEKETNPGSVCDNAVWEWREAFWGPCGGKVGAHILVP